MQPHLSGICIEVCDNACTSTYNEICFSTWKDTYKVAWSDISNSPYNGPTIVSSPTPDACIDIWSGTCNSIYKAIWNDYTSTTAVVSLTQREITPETPPEMRHETGLGTKLDRYLKHWNETKENGYTFTSNSIWNKTIRDGSTRD